MELMTKYAPVRKEEGALVFPDFMDFCPNQTPREMFLKGVFGGTYWRPIHSRITGKDYQEMHLEFPLAWWKGIDEVCLTRPESDYDVQRNYYKAKSGTDLLYWEAKGWMHPQDPYGWVQWYCRFYQGRRTADDERQVKRWLAFAGPKGRFRRRLIRMLQEQGTTFDDASVSPVIRQGLLQWAYVLTPMDFRADQQRR